MVTSSEMVEAMPPPPDQKANFVDPLNQTVSTIALHTVCLTLITLCVAMRIYTREYILKQLGASDSKALSSFCIIRVFINADGGQIFACSPM